ncbi:MAG: hypothetical protein GY861_06060, partial [bacterium]|nr:hypothetical protein [bacterium]
FQDHESQNSNGEIEKIKQERNAIENTRYWSTMYINTVTANKQDRDNFRASEDIYVGINKAGWDPESLETLEKQGRPANTLNIVKPNIDKVYGQIVRNPNKITFTPSNQENVAKTNIVQSLYDYDYERGDYSKEWNRFVKDTLNHTGVMEMYKDYTHSKLGNVGRKALNRFIDIEFDEFWKTDNIRDCSHAYKSSWMTARQLRDNYNVRNNDEIDLAIKNYENRDGAMDSIEEPQYLAETDSLFIDGAGQRFRVIEVVYMQTVYKEKLYSKKLKRYLDANENPDIKRDDKGTIVENDDYVKRIDTVNICKVMTIAPGLVHGLILQEGDHPIQVGHLPFYVASTDNTGGVRQGVSTGLIDCQSTYNKRNSMITGNQITSGNGGLIVKEDFFKDEREFKNFQKNKATPGKVFKAASDARADGIMQIPRSDLPQGTQDSVQQMFNFAEWYTNTTAAVSGRSEGANESGVLFRDKKDQAQVAHVGIVEILASVEKMWAEDYFYACKTVYKGKERDFTNAKTGAQFTINKKVLTTPEESNYTIVGELANYKTVNEIATLPRHDVVIKKSELGLDQKQRALSIFAEMSQRTKNPIAQSIYEKAMAPLLDMPEQYVSQLETAADMFIELQLAQTKNNIKLLNDGMVQSDVNTKMLASQAGMQQQGGMEQAQ